MKGAETQKGTLEIEKTESDLQGDLERLAEQEMTNLDPIRDINDILISSEWASEFRGFIWGEGMLYIQKAQKGFPIYIRVTLRSDDQVVLQEFQRRLGGTIGPRKTGNGNSKPVVLWQVADTLDCLRIARLLKTEFPFKKALQLTKWQQALLLKKRKGLRHYTKLERKFMEEAARELQRLKQWIV